MTELLLVAVVTMLVTVWLCWVCATAPIAGWSAPPPPVQRPSSKPRMSGIIPPPSAATPQSAPYLAMPGQSVLGWMPPMSTDIMLHVPAPHIPHPAHESSQCIVHEPQAFTASCEAPATTDCSSSFDCSPSFDCSSGSFGD